MAALERFEDAYVEQRYPPNPPAALVSSTSVRILEAVLGPEGVEQILTHTWARLHVVTALCRGCPPWSTPASSCSGWGSPP